VLCRPSPLSWPSGQAGLHHRPQTSYPLCGLPYTNHRCQQQLMQLHKLQMVAAIKTAWQAVAGTTPGQQHIKNPWRCWNGDQSVGRCVDRHMGNIIDPITLHCVLQAQCYKDRHVASCCHDLPPAADFLTLSPAASIPCYSYPNTQNPAARTQQQPTSRTPVQ
jgi:hypothetical protein